MQTWNCSAIVQIKTKTMQNNLRFTTLTKHMNNQTNCPFNLENLKKTWNSLVFNVWIDIKLYMILDNKVPPNLKLTKHDFCINCWSIWTYECKFVFQIKKTIFDTDYWLWQLKIHQFEVPGIMLIDNIQEFPWRPFIFVIKSSWFCTCNLETPLSNRH